MKISISTLILTICLCLPIVSIGADARIQLIEINTQNTQMVMSVNSQGELLFHHYGKKIGDCTPFLLKKSYRRADYGIDPMGYSTRGGRNFNEPALAVTHFDGNLNTNLVYTSHNTTPLSDSNVRQTVIVLRDSKYPLTVELRYTAHQAEDVIVCSSKITNDEGGSILLDNYFSSYLPLKASEYHLSHFYGSWAREMCVDQTQLKHGTKSIENRKQVRTTHTENPSFILSLNAPMQEESGEAIIGALAWSGNFKLNFEVDEFDILNISSGINPYSAAYHLDKGQSLTTPDMIYTYSDSGVGQASRNMHDWARNYGIWSPKTMRPTLLNSWEGAYFDFNAQTITKMIDDAADMGLEMFVLDDGWFGNNYPRNNTNAGLGDWQVNKKKLPEGIAYMADHAVRRGLKFGIWIEPEMVSPDSDLAKAHPEWIVRTPEFEATTMRQQLLLDLCNPAVQEFVFDVFDNVMKLSPNISYIKWDANRHVEGVGSAYLPKGRQSHFWIEYTRGLYRVYERIREKYPHVLIQACSSGGGRVEYGALKYHDEVWTSDNTDALSRIFIQYGTNFIYPAVVTGSHVSATPNHQTNNNTPLKFRFDLAMSGRLGMELQPKDMSDAERIFAREAINNYKSIRDIVTDGDLYRIMSPYDAKGYYSLMYVAKDKSRAVVFCYNLKYQGRTLTPKFRLAGLDADKSYVLREINTPKPRFWGDGKRFNGGYLREEGINPQLNKVFDSAVYLLEQAQ